MIQVLGHEQQKTRLEEAVAKGLLAHAHLWVGVSGTGKRTLARRMAQKLICEKGGCGECPLCQRIEQGASECHLEIQPDGSQIKLDQIREVTRFLSLQKVGRARVVLIDEASRMNPQAANALLKTLEEPPEDSYFFLIASSSGGILPTIRSRCQVLRFSPLKESEIAQLSGLVPLDWRVAASQGSLSVLEEISNPDYLELRTQAFKAMEELVAPGSKDLGELENLFKKREESGIVLRFWQQILRDARRDQAGSEKGQIHSDFQDLFKALSRLGASVLDELYVQTLKLEQDWASNVDRQILFESWKIESRRTLQSGAYQ